MLNITNNYLFTTLFSQYVKELFELNRSEDVWIANPRPRVTSNQLYIPFKKIESSIKKNYLVEANGVEPMTLCVQGRCSSQLSYAPEYCRSINQADIIAKSYHKGLSFTRTKV